MKYNFRDILTETTERQGGQELVVFSVTNEGIKPRDDKFTTELSEDYSNNKVIRRGNIIFGNSRHILNYGVMKFGKLGSVSSAYYVFEVNNNIVIPSYLDLYMNVNRKNMLHIKKPGARDNQPIDKSVLYDTELEIPPLDTQKRILNLIELFDNVIKKSLKIIKQLEEFNAQLYKKWFVNFEFIDENGKNYKDNGGKMLNSKFGEIPLGWKIKKLGSVINISYGKNYPTKNLLKSGYPVFGGNGIIGYSDTFLYEKSQVIVACRGMASGKVSYTFPFSYVTNNSLVLSPKKDINYEFLKQFALYYQFYKFVTGSAQPQITINSIKEAEILIPPSELIEDFSKKTSEINKMIIDTQILIDNFVNKRNLLLPKLILGEVTIPIEEKIHVN